MLDDLQRFSSDAFPDALRRPAWSAALAAASLRSTEPQDAQHRRTDLRAYGACRTNGLGTVFLRFSSSPQVLLPVAPGAAHGGPVLVLALLEGSATLVDGHETVALDPARMALLDPARPWRLELRSPCRGLAVKIASASFLLRLVRTGAHDLNIVDGGQGVGAMCCSVLRSIADGIDELTPHELLAIEATLTDLLVICLTHDEDPRRDDATAVRLGHLRRACRSIEARLGDSGLSIEEIGRLEGFSVRYLQQLFKGAATTFGGFVRERRLERCRIDLADRALDHFTIAELCFRWGFGDAANFSRAFTQRFGTSPKAYRAGRAADTAVRAQRGRPRHATAPDRPAVQAGDDTEAGASPTGVHAVLDDHARTTAARAGSAPTHHYLPVSEHTVHWGYFSAALKPVLRVRSGDIVTIDTLTQHASDDHERMIDGDPGAESVFHWTRERKAVDRRGAGPADASIFGRGTGEGFGVHICTGPVYVEDAEPGDVLEIRILDVRLRPSCHPKYRGRFFGSNAATWWGFHYHDLITEPRKREVVTLYEIDAASEPPCARAVYSFRWTPQTDPYGVRHDTIDYPGLVVDESTVVKRFGVLERARVPIRPHFGVLAVAPREPGLIDSVPPGYFGGNLDNWRAGKGAKLFLPVSVPGALFSAGDPHACQGDSELCGTAIECSLTGVFQLALHKAARIEGTFLAGLDYPFLETDDAWVLQGLSHPNHLVELGPDAQAEIYRKSSLEGAMRDAFHKARRYLMEAQGLTEDEAISLISVAVDFGVTQVVDGNWGVHAVIGKRLFPDVPGAPRTA
jgi:acetamidase/formamidase/AraC-like DNA-binding protein